MSFDKTLARSGRCYVAHFHNLALTVWQDRPDAEIAKATISFAEALRPKYARFSVVHIVEDGAGLPTPDGRDELVAGARKNKPHVACVGLLLPRVSVVATMLRVFIRSVRTLLRGDLNTVVEQDVDALARQIIELHVRDTGVRIAAADLVAAIGEARRLAALAAPGAGA